MTAAEHLLILPRNDPDQTNVVCAGTKVVEQLVIDVPAVEVS